MPAYPKTAWTETTPITFDLLNKQEDGIEAAQATADSALAAASGGPSSAVVVAHGSNAATARPVTPNPVVWVGPVYPTNLNAGSGDVHVDTDQVGLDAEAVRDLIGVTLVAGTGITITPNDAGESVTVATTGGGGGSAGLFARKTADTFRTSNTDTDDPHLTVNVTANTTYMVEGFLRFEAATTGDFKVRLVAPNQSSVQVMYLGPALAASGTTGSVNVSVDEFARTLGGAGASNDMGVILRGTVAVGATAGAAVLSWAQGTTDPTPTILYANSWIRLTPVS